MGGGTCCIVSKGYQVKPSPGPSSRRAQGPSQHRLWCWSLQGFPATSSKYSLPALDGHLSALNSWKCTSQLRVCCCKPSGAWAWLGSCLTLAPECASCLELLGAIPLPSPQFPPAGTPSLPLPAVPSPGVQVRARPRCTQLGSSCPALPLPPASAQGVPHTALAAGKCLGPSLAQDGSCSGVVAVAWVLPCTSHSRCSHRPAAA